ncbi:hypothetical protein Ndes2437B_g06762 [Nannochloris sp. 'desiccata']
MHSHREQNGHSRFLGLKPKDIVKDLCGSDLLQMLRDAMASRGLVVGDDPPSPFGAPWFHDYGETPGGGDNTPFGSPSGSVRVHCVQPPDTIERDRRPTRLQRNS